MTNVSLQVLRSSGNAFCTKRFALNCSRTLAGSRFLKPRFFITLSGRFGIECGCGLSGRGRLKSLPLELLHLSHPLQGNRSFEKASTRFLRQGVSEKTTSQSPYLRWGSSENPLRRRGGAQRRRSRSAGVGWFPLPKTPLKSPLVQGGTAFSLNVAPQRGKKNSLF
jgi:hypothetical protein